MLIGSLDRADESDMARDPDPARKRGSVAANSAMAAMVALCAASFVALAANAGAKVSSAATAAPASRTKVYWVALTGSDKNSGATRDQALRTVAEAWQRIPQGVTLNAKVVIKVTKGTYKRTDTPNYWEQRYGAPNATITIVSVDGPLAATFRGDMNVFDVRHLIVDGVRISAGGDAFHCERCADVTLRHVELDGGKRLAHDLLKVNQTNNFVLEDSDVHGADDNALDFVAVRGGRVARNRIHDALDWCAYAKGGSSDIVVEGNEIFDCGTGGFTAGQGTGLEFMEAPNLTYEAERITVRANSIHDTDGAGLGVNGGLRITISGNRLERVGRRSHLVEFGFGNRSCDGDVIRCRQRLAAGAWGTSALGDGENFVRIPNREVSFTDNTIENPPGYESQWQQFFVAGEYAGAEQGASAKNPNPARADDGLVIRGNTIRNGNGDKPLGVGDDQGCRSANPTCNAAQLVRDNRINR